MEAHGIRGIAASLLPIALTVVVVARAWRQAPLADLRSRELLVNRAADDDQRFEALRHSLPAIGVVGFLSEEPEDSRIAGIPEIRALLEQRSMPSPLAESVGPAKDRIDAAVFEELKALESSARMESLRPEDVAALREYDRLRAQYKRSLRLTQYALAPLVVVSGDGPSWVVGYFPFGSPPSAADLASRGLATVRDFGDGVVLFRRRR